MTQDSDREDARTPAPAPAPAPPRAPALRPEAERALRERGLDPSALAPLAGDASTRRYFRVAPGAAAGAREGDGGSASLILMDCGAPLPGVDASGRDGFAFTRWQAFYRELGIRVPAIVDVDRPAGLVLLEDLGDELLQYRVEAAGPAACEGFYLRSVHWGRVLAEEGAARYDPASDPDEDPLVPARLALETDLFLVHASGGSPAAGLPPLRAAARALDESAADALLRARALLHELCDDVHAFGPMAPCHRDYHARNLILVPGEAGDDVAVIDFQDTRRGPRAYDLASLAWDPYVTLPQPLVERLVQAWRPSDVRAADWDDEVRLAAGQRLLKAAGSYAWLSRACGKPQYAQWLAPALRRAHERLERWPRRDELWRALRSAGAIAAAGDGAP